MAKSTAAVYAQLRRDNENAAREALRFLIPQRYHTSELTSNGELNASAKVLLATKNYLDDLAVNDQSTRQTQDQTERPTSDGDADLPFSMPPIGDTGDETVDEQMRRLRQVATRLVQKVEEKVQVGYGTCRAFKVIIENATDQIIDIIEAVKKTK